LVLSQGLRPVALGLCGGLMIAAAAGGLVRTLLFGVGATDAKTLAVVVVVLGAVATAACLMPAQSAARIDPAIVLRDE